MNELTDKLGEPVEPLTGDEIKAFRAGKEYRDAVNIVKAKWRKAIIGLSAVVMAGAGIVTVASALLAAIARKYGAG